MPGCVAPLLSRRRFLRAATIALAASPFLAACQLFEQESPAQTPTPGQPAVAVGSSPTPTSTPPTPTPAPSPTPVVVRLEYWHFGGTTRWREVNRSLVDQYNASQGQVRVELSDRDWAKQREDVLAALSANSAPHLVHIHSKYVVELGKLGVLHPLDSFADWPRFSSAFLPGYVELTRYSGHYYGFGIHPLPFVLAVNRQMLEEVGLKPPKTWDDFVEVTGKLAQPEDNIFGYTIPAGLNIDTAYRWVAWLYGNGGVVLTEDWRQPAFNDQPGVEALEMLMDLQSSGGLAPGVVNYSFAENADQWGLRKAAMSTEGPWWQKLIGDQYGLDAEKVLSIVRHPFPARPGGPLKPATLVDMPMLAILAKSRPLESAWDFHKWLRRDEVDLQFVDPTQGDGLPMCKKAYAPETKWKYIGKEAFAEAANSLRPWPYHPKMAAIQNKVAEAVHAALSGAEVTAQEVLDKAAKGVQGIIST